MSGVLKLKEETLISCVMCLYLTKFRITQTVIFPLTFYGSENWSLKKEDRKILKNDIEIKRSGLVKLLA